MEPINDAEYELTIDENSLDSEWLKQPRICLRYGLLLAECRKRLDEARNELEVVRADLDKEIRTSPDAYGIGKVTEAAIQSAIQTNTKYQEAQKQLTEAKYNVDLLNAVMQAVEQKRSALENLVKLFLSGYYGKPKTENEDDWDDLVKRRLRRRSKENA